MKNNKPSVISVVLHPFVIFDSRVLKECRSLQKSGFDVRVVGFHQDRLKEFDTIWDVAVHRIKLKTTSSRYLKYLEFIYRIIRYYRNTDIIHCNDLQTLPIGVIIKKFFSKSIKIVYDAHEYETEVYSYKGIKKHFIKILERSLIRYADCVITVNDSIAREYVRLYGIPIPYIVLNCPPYQDAEKKNIFRKDLGIRDDQTIFLYQGGLGEGRGIELILQAFGRLEEDNVVIFMGSGPLEEMIKEYAEKYPNVFYHKAVPPDVLLEYTSSADFGLIIFKNICLNHYYCSPTKMFEYIMAEIPLIVSDLYELRRMVEGNGIGIVMRDYSVESLIEAIRDVDRIDRDKMSDNLKRLKRIYNWEEQEKVLLKAYD